MTDDELFNLAMKTRLAGNDSAGLLLINRDDFNRMCLYTYGRYSGYSTNHDASVSIRFVINAIRRSREAAGQGDEASA